MSGGSLSNHVVGTATLTLYGWIAEWDTTSVPNGAYTLESVATEAGGDDGDELPRPRQRRQPSALSGPLERPVARHS